MARDADRSLLLGPMVGARGTAAHRGAATAVGASSGAARRRAAAAIGGADTPSGVVIERRRAPANAKDNAATCDDITDADIDKDLSLVRERDRDQEGKSRRHLLGLHPFPGLPRGARLREPRGGVAGAGSSSSDELGIGRNVLTTTIAMAARPSQKNEIKDDEVKNEQARPCLPSRELPQW
jgi:hypothetical protein